MKLTPKENYLRVLHGEIPDDIPIYTQRLARGDDVNTYANLLFEPTVISPLSTRPGEANIWGVRYIGCDAADGAMISDPNHRLLDDITKWRDVIKAPDLSDYDWEMMAKKEMDATGIDRRYTAVSYNSNQGMFQLMMSMMGFEGGLMALFEEPEECHAMLDYICDFYCDCIEKSIDYYKPDVFTMKDDTAGATAPFISMAMYKEFFLPLYDRQAKFARDRGIPITYHNCGVSMHFVEEAINIGVNSWDPAQAMNDLATFKEKHGRSCAICGGWINREELLAPDATDEMVYASVQNTLDHWAPGGGYIWTGNLLGGSMDPEIRRKNAVVTKAVKELGADYYNKH